MLRSSLRRPLTAAALCAALTACSGETTSATNGTAGGPPSQGSTSHVNATDPDGGAERSTPRPRPTQDSNTELARDAATGGSGSSREAGRPETLDGLDLSGIVLPGSEPGARPAGVTGATPAPLVDSTLTVDGDDTARFGVVKEGDERQHQWDLVVEGEDPVNVYDERSTCGCTLGRLELVAPDGSVTDYVKGTDIPTDHVLRVHGTLTTEGKRGEQAHSITLRHNGKNRATLLHFEAEVLPTFEVAPNAYFNFGEFFVNESRSGEVVVTSPVVDRFALALDTSFGLPDYMNVELAPLDAIDDDGRASSWSVSATVGPNAPENFAGQQSLTVILKSDIEMVGAPPLTSGEPRTRLLNIYVYARVKSLVHANPSYVSFGAISAGADARREFNIEFSDGTFDLERMRNVSFVARNVDDQEFYDEFFNSSVQEGEDGRSVIVSLWFDDWPSDRVGPFGGDIVIDIGHPTRPELKVPFSGVCRDLR